ncbi:MAG: bifunctional [glutamate--ammonia ligase]-adenylyl-L-tyrosine phosphorylase/[glutamate--ammonia-ligase] adenylyltransferase [Burkholderiaceae bacterium]
MNLSPAAGPSRWRNRLAQARPEWAARIAALAALPVARVAISAVLADERGDAWRDEAHLRTGLRRLRCVVFAALIDRDLDGRADVAEVMLAMSALAEIAIAEALVLHSHALAAIHGRPHAVDGTPQDLLVIGMGKLGGRELNVSSDIDLIFVYAEDGDTRAEDATSIRAITNAEFFARLGRKLMASLSEVSADGFVFRVDMRLRPDGDSGPLVTSFAMLERYLVGSARDWERFAWIKARVVSPPVFATDNASIEALERLVTPFVYRRYLDFGAIDALRRLHGQIREEAARREATRRGRSARNGAAQASHRIDVKLGPGGIREIEFIAQHFQLIRGGRDPALRLRPTVATIDALVREGLLAHEVGQKLKAAYAFLRNVEHRVQYLDDAQTHTLPPREREDDCTRVAAMCVRLLDASATPDFDGLVETLERHRGLVEHQFDAVFGLDPLDPVTGTAIDAADASDLWSAFSELSPLHARDDAAAAAVNQRLSTLGFEPPDGAFGRLVGLARSARLRALSSSARARLDALVPRLIDASSREKDPTATLGRWFDLLEAIAGRSAYLALLGEYPAASRAVTRLLAASPWAAQYLTRHPLLLDELIDAPESDRGIRDAATWAAHWADAGRTLARQLATASADPERQMDLLREMHHGETFRLLIEDLDGRLTIEMLSDQLSALADLTLEATLSACWSQFVASRPDDRTAPATPAFAMIAYGKLGGKELGYVSDLDLVFLFDQRADADQVAAAQRYARFAQRLNLWLTARTTAGALFEIDLRLRPDGAAGLVVSSFEAWSRYERRDHDVGAWTWEHQALTRARFCAGDRALGALFEEERLAILSARDPDEAGRAQLRDEIVAMRKRIHEGHPNRSPQFDLKHDEGGMVDIEFAVQYLVLGYGAVHRELLANVGNIALLARAAGTGLIDARDASEVADAYRLYRARQHAARLADPLAPAARVEAHAYPGERASVRQLWHRLFDGSV